MLCNAHWWLQNISIQLKLQIWSVIFRKTSRLNRKGFVLYVYGSSNKINYLNLFYLSQTASCKSGKSSRIMLTVSKDRTDSPFQTVCSRWEYCAVILPCCSVWKVQRQNEESLLFSILTGSVQISGHITGTVKEVMAVVIFQKVRPHCCVVLNHKLRQL